jgi:Zn-dependent protease with chaperone function
LSTPRIGNYVISPREIAPSWVALYGITLAVQCVCGFIRGFVVAVVLFIPSQFFTVLAAHLNTIALVIGFGPLALSLLTLVLPFGGIFWEQAVGGRSPSARERLIYEDAIAQLRLVDPTVRMPHRWFVLDSPEVNAAAYGDSLMVTRGLLESVYATAVIAHELGHLNSSDARLTAALWRMTTPPRGEVGKRWKAIAFLATGAAGMSMMRGAWSAYWRHREHEADRYAEALGQGAALGEFLEDHVLDDLPVPFMWLSDHSHPATEHRLDRMSQT